MHVPPPEHDVIQALDDLKQLTTGQLRSLVFPDAKSPTTCYRVLTRLERDGYIALVVKRRHGENIWQLGSQGWRLMGHTGRWYGRALSYHSLAIGDVAVRLRQAERAGSIRVASQVTEPDCWLMVQGVDLRPDMYLELERPETGATLLVFVEVDMGTEPARRITEKLERYVSAYQRATAADLPYLPRIVFVCDKEPRRAEIARLIAKLPETEARRFRSVLLETFPQYMG